MTEPKKYILPHIRNTVVVSRENNHRDEPVQRTRNNTRHNRRRDLSHGSKSNTKGIVSEKNIQHVSDIQIPDVIQSPIVESSHIDERTTELSGKLIGELLSEDLSEIKRDKSKLYDHEINLIRKISDIKKYYSDKKLQDDFNEWLTHYEEGLQQMYHACVDNNLGLSYEGFVRLAYDCTDISYNRKKFKYTRPLI